MLADRGIVAQREARDEFVRMRGLGGGAAALFLFASRPGGLRSTETW